MTFEVHSGHQSFTPVIPPMPAADASYFQRWLHVRKNLVSVWTEEDYTLSLSQARFLRQQYIVCSSSDTVRHVLLSNHDNYDRKSPQMRHALEPLLGDGLFISDGPLWKERREICAPPFLGKFLPPFADVMSGTVAELAEKWDDVPAGGHIDVLNEMAKLTARIIGRAVFGNALPDQDAAQVVAGFTKYQSMIEQMSIADTFGLPFLRSFSNPWRQRKVQKHAKEVHAVVERLLREFGDAPRTQFRSLMSIILDHLEPANGNESACPLSREAMRNEALVLFMAGHETTANTWAWVWYLLDGDQEATANLHRELDTVLEGRPPSLADVPNLVYTRAIIDEALRLYPPVPLLSRQARNADQIRDISVEPGAIILVVPWVLHRHRSYWEEPDQFRPERFLPGAPRIDKFIYIPFSAGYRVCLGQRFGQTEAILCLAALAQKFRLRLKKDHKVEVDCRLTLRPKGGLPMTVEPRNP